jgi:hypothetical protein
MQGIVAHQESKGHREFLSMPSNGYDWGVTFGNGNGVRLTSINPRPGVRKATF